MLLLTVVTPVYNEEKVVEEFHKRLSDVLDKINDYNCKILFVVDKCEDLTLSILEKIAINDSRIQIISLSSRFGHQMCLMAGIEKAQNSDIVVTMDSDLQHPPSLIPKLIDEHKRGVEIVYTIRKSNTSVGIFRKLLGKLFYYIIGKIGSVQINSNAADFRLITNKVVKILCNDFKERNLFLRGIFPLIGFNQSYVCYDANQRFAGNSKFTLSKTFKLAIAGIVSFSTKPLFLGIIFGLALACAAFIMIAFTMLNYFVDKTIPSGWTTIVTLLLLFNGVQLLIIGIIGLYIGDISSEVKKRPRYIVDKEIGFK